MNGIFTCSYKHLHDVWHDCLRRGADATAARIAKEIARRALEGQPDKLEIAA